MAFLRRNRGSLAGIALALVLVAAQSVAAMHDLEHESGSAQNRVCTTCVAASQLGAAAIDTGATPQAADSFTLFDTAAATACHSAQVLAPRPRGPPAHV